MTKIVTELFIETKETFVIKRKRFLVRAWCKDCEREVNMSPPSEAAYLTCQDAQAIYQLIDRNDIHFSFPESETPLICLRSLCLI